MVNFGQDVSRRDRVFGPIAHPSPQTLEDKTRTEGEEKRELDEGKKMKKKTS